MFDFGAEDRGPGSRRLGLASGSWTSCPRFLCLFLSSCRAQYGYCRLSKCETLVRANMIFHGLQLPLTSAADRCHLFPSMNTKKSWARVERAERLDEMMAQLSFTCNSLVLESLLQPFNEQTIGEKMAYRGVTFGFNLEEVSALMEFVMPHSKTTTKRCPTCFRQRAGRFLGNC